MVQCDCLVLYHVCVIVLCYTMCVYIVSCGVVRLSCAVPCQCYCLVMYHVCTLFHVEQCDCLVLYHVCVDCLWVALDCIHVYSGCNMKRHCAVSAYFQTPSTRAPDAWSSLIVLHCTLSVLIAIALPRIQGKVQHKPALYHVCVDCYYIAKDSGQHPT